VTVNRKAPLRPGGAVKSRRWPMDRRYYSPFWVGFTVVLSGIFMVMAFPLFARKMGMLLGFFVTVFCLAIIWLRYLFIAWIFTRGEKGGKDKNAENGYI
jgi:hypothetical protein